MTFWQSSRISASLLVVSSCGMIQVHWGGGLRLSEKGSAPLHSDQRKRAYTANRGALTPFCTASNCFDVNILLQNCQRRGGTAVLPLQAPAPTTGSEQLPQDACGQL